MVKIGGAGDLKLGGINESMPESESVSVEPELKADLDCLSRIESAINTEKKSSPANLPFLIRVENMLAEERLRRIAQERKTRKQTKLKDSVNSTAVLNDPTTLLTFLTSDNLFLLDICSYFLFLKSVLSCLKRLLFPVKTKKPNMGRGVDDKMWMLVLISHFGKMGGSL